MYRILIVEDDRGIAEAIARQAARARRQTGPRVRVLPVLATARWAPVPLDRGAVCAPARRT